MILFIDTSALVKLYIAEPGSELMGEAAQEAVIAVSTLTFAELHATFARRLREELHSPPSLLSSAVVWQTTGRTSCKFRPGPRCSPSYHPSASGIRSGVPMRYN